MASSHSFAFVPDAWDTLRAEAIRAEQTVAVHPDVARWRAYRALDMVLATIEAYEGFPPQHRPLAERLTHTSFVAWLGNHPAPVKMWMHRIRQAGMVGAHVDSEWRRSVEDARRVVETLHKLIWWLVSVYDAPPQPERPSLQWDDVTPETPPSRSADAPHAEDTNTAPDASSQSERKQVDASSEEKTARPAASSPVGNASVRQWLAQLRGAVEEPSAAEVDTAAARLLHHIHDVNHAILNRFDSR